jgi:hypothetical protein
VVTAKASIFLSTYARQSSSVVHIALSRTINLMEMEKAVIPETTNSFGDDAVLSASLHWITKLKLSHEWLQPESFPPETSRMKLSRAFSFCIRHEATVAPTRLRYESRSIIIKKSESCMKTVKLQGEGKVSV